MRLSFTSFLHLFYVEVTTPPGACARVRDNEVYDPLRTQGSPDKAVALHPLTLPSVNAKTLNRGVEMLLSAWVRLRPVVAAAAGMQSETLCPWQDMGEPK